ncbi:LytR family transcriptional regulator [Bacillus sp. RG28]|uniref:Polyisoprenyl-teichoic acid--peptidoglycan teichoic acid transferase TagU n=2 Tax=Gottfriedia endophytica TaxID=2820819 RepID=A0A940NR70_9BACI|nr:LytR family transcriptional regulator [Gottfriedia endophytica]MBP0726068.1 LytR family transcriptional regulator [Gottfriedia endophytica]
MKKVFIAFIVFIGLILVGVGVYAYTIYTDIQKTTEVIHKPIKKSDKREEQVSVEKKQPFSILLLGVDHRPGDVGRSDSMILMTVNPTDNRTEMVSIPRDTRTTIVGKGKIDKINHAYAFGGVQMAVNTVENFLNIPIDYYIKVNMEGFKDIVNAVSGVDVDNDLDFTYEGNHFKKGKLHLNGNEALSYSRMRKLDARGDFGREMRQRQVIEAVLKKGASVSTLTSYNDVLKAIQNNIETNLTLNDMIAIQKDYKDAASNVNEVQITGKGTKIDGIYYLQVPKEEQDHIATQLRQQLALQ